MPFNRTKDMNIFIQKIKKDWWKLLIMLFVYRLITLCFGEAVSTVKASYLILFFRELIVAALIVLLTIFIAVTYTDGKPVQAKVVACCKKCFPLLIILAALAGLDLFVSQSALAADFLKETLKLNAGYATAGYMLVSGAVAFTLLLGFLAAYKNETTFLKGLAVLFTKNAALTAIVVLINIAVSLLVTAAIFHANVRSFALTALVFAAMFVQNALLPYYFLGGVKK